MSGQTDSRTPPDDLRRRAEQLARERAGGAPGDLEALSLDQTKRLLHELQVHQIELEMQNEELRRTQNELEVSRARYFDLYDLAPVGYLSVSEAGMILEANLTFASMVGMESSRAALLMRPASSFIFPEDQDLYYFHRKQLLETHVAEVCELRMLRVDGTRFWARLDATLADDSEGLVCRMVVSDVTGRKHAEDENAALQEGLNRAEKMESVGRLAGGVAHDLNNTLMPILGYGEILLGSLSSEDARRRYAEHMVHSAEHARDLVRQLLVFSRQKADAFEPIELNDAVAGFADVLKGTMRDGIITDFIISPCRLTISGDKFQLQQVITNLATNAADAMPQGGVLTIETSSAEVGPHGAATCEGLAPGRYALLTVSDTGTGMSADTLSHIFEPFFTTKPVGKGVGLGLAAVHGIVKQHGGSIAVESEAGRGTTFRIWLPVIEVT